MSNFLTNKKTK